MTSEDFDDSAEYGLVMPFLPVESRGGPYDDAAYTAGWEMGRLDAVLSTAATLGLLPDTHIYIHHENRDQVDLVAMSHGFRAFYEQVEGYGEWGEFGFSKAIPDEDEEVS